MSDRGIIAETARRELALRERDWPIEVREGRMDAGTANADIAAWRAIAAMIEQGSAETQLGWEDLIGALRTAEDRRVEAAIAANGTRKEAVREERLGRIVTIRRLFERNAWRHGKCLSEKIAA